MPTISHLKETMVKLKVSPEIIAEIEDEDYTNTPEERLQSTLAAIDKMDELLTMNQRLAIMEKQGCCKGGKYEKDCKAFGKEHADKPLAEKLALLSGVEYMMSPWLNDDGTITVSWGDWQNGKNMCSCGQIKKLKQPYSVSPTYCGCCAGHHLYHYQNALKVKLRLKKINSSPLNTNGEKPCSFTFEIIG